MLKIKPLFKSFSHAFQGIKVLFKTEQSFRLQILAGLAVLILLGVLPVTIFETIVVLLLIVLILVLEMINSIFERLVDTFKPRIHPVVGEIKDIMAATVFVASIFAAVVGFLIFYPRFISLF